MKKIVAGLLSTVLVAYANTQEIMKKFQEIFPNTHIKKVEESPIKGLYEVILKDGKILYTDGNYLFIGHIFTFTGKDLTQEKIDKLTAKNIDEIDLSKALKIGNGKTVVIEVSDPECPFCRRAEKIFENKDVSRYVFFYPLPFHKRAKPLAIHILCSDTPEKEYLKVMNGGLDHNHLTYCPEGEKKLSQMEAEVRNLNIKGTPTFWIKTEKGWRKIEGLNPVIFQYFREVRQK